MFIERLMSTESVPDESQPPLICEIPPDAQAVMYRIKTKNLNSHRYGCTTVDVWFQAPAPILFQQTSRGVITVIVLNQEVIQIPEQVKDMGFILEIGCLRQAKTTL